MENHHENYANICTKDTIWRSIWIKFLLQVSSYIITFFKIRRNLKVSIARSLGKEKSVEPKVIVIGKQKSCDNYLENVAPFSRLHVANVIHTNINNKVGAAIKVVKSCEADGIILLQNEKSNKFCHYF